MRIRTRAVLGLCASLLAVGAIPAAASAEIAAVTFQTPRTPTCAGDVERASWPAASVAGLTGYRVFRSITTMNPPLSSTVEVGPTQTTLEFTADLFGLYVVKVYVLTSAGEGPEVANGTLLVGRAPQAAEWFSAGASAANGSAVVPYHWSFSTPQFNATGGLPTTVRVTASPGGAYVDVPGGERASFTGLANGATYTFGAVTSNACGSVAGGPSPSYTPGIAPTWERNTPPLKSGKISYSYKFTADGDPKPVLSLMNAPSWLTLARNGVVSGKPPLGTESFSYSVVARNGVGIVPYQDTTLVAGPFNVTLAK